MNGVRHPPQQKGCRETRPRHPGREDDQPPVHERHGRRAEPHPHRRTERPPTAREQRQHEDGRDGHREPGRALRRLRVVPQRHVERADHRHKHDDDVDAAAADAGGESLHPSTVREAITPAPLPGDRGDT